MPDLPVSPELVAADALLRREQPGRAPVVAAGLGSPGRRLRTGGVSAPGGSSGGCGPSGRTRPLGPPRRQRCSWCPGGPPTWRAGARCSTGWPPTTDGGPLVLASTRARCRRRHRRASARTACAWGLGDPRADVSIRRDLRAAGCRGRRPARRRPPGRARSGRSPRSGRWPGPSRCGRGCPVRRRAQPLRARGSGGGARRRSAWGCRSCPPSTGRSSRTTHVGSAARWTGSACGGRPGPTRWSARGWRPTRSS